MMPGVELLLFFCYRGFNFRLNPILSPGLYNSTGCTRRYGDLWPVWTGPLITAFYYFSTEKILHRLNFACTVTISSINSTLGTTTSKKHGHACRDTLTCLSAPVETKFPVRLCKSKNLLSPKNCTCASIFVHQVHITSKNLHPSNMALHTSHCHISFE
jgi:hypothetical protein